MERELTKEEKLERVWADLARLPEILAEKERQRLARIEFTEQVFGKVVEELKARKAQKKSGSA